MTRKEYDIERLQELRCSIAEAINKFELGQQHFPKITEKLNAVIGDINEELDQIE